MNPHEGLAAVAEQAGPQPRDVAVAIEDVVIEAAVDAGMGLLREAEELAARAVGWATGARWTITPGRTTPAGMSV